MKKLIAFVLCTAVILCLCSCGAKTAVPEQDSTQLYGTWWDIISKRAYAEISPAEDGKYKITVHWGGSAFESEEWSMTAVAEDGKLLYSDGKSSIITYQDESNYDEEVLYTDSTGYFIFDSDRLLWSDEKDPETSLTRVFVKEGEDTPRDLEFIGFYSSDYDGSTLEIGYNNELGFLIDMNIVRLAQLTGTASYNKETDSLDASVIDPAEGEMKLNIALNDGKVTVTVTESNWELLSEGEIFQFE